jgi:hypothetical protein
MLAQYVNMSEVDETKLQVFDNHVQTLIERIRADEQYTEDVIAFEVSDKARELTDKIVMYLEQTDGKVVSAFERSMVLLHIGGMVDTQA